MGYTWSVRRSVTATVLAFALACGSGEPRRLELARDTVFLYGAERSESKSLVDLANDSLAGHVTLTARDRALVRTGGSWTNCLREGSTEVEARAGSLVDTLVIICRFATKLAGETYYELQPDAPPVTLSATASFPSGDSITLRPVKAVSNDTTVAAIEDGAMHPRGVGYAGVTVDYGGLRLRATVHVRRTIFDSVLTLDAGASRRWQLDDGRYLISVHVESRQDLNRLNMETEGLNCSRDPRDENTIHCVTTQGAQVTMLNRGSMLGAKSAGTAQAKVRIHQVR